MQHLGLQLEDQRRHNTLLKEYNDRIEQEIEQQKADKITAEEATQRTLDCTQIFNIAMVNVLYSCA